MFCELSRNQPILRFDVILRHDWPIEKCLLHFRVFFGGKTKKPCFDLFTHWLIKQITKTYRNHFSRSCENRSSFACRDEKISGGLVWHIAILLDNFGPCNNMPINSGKQDTDCQKLSISRHTLPSSCQNGLLGLSEVKSSLLSHQIKPNIVIQTWAQLALERYNLKDR